VRNKGCNKKLIGIIVYEYQYCGLDNNSKEFLCPVMYFSKDLRACEIHELTFIRPEEHLQHMTLQCSHQSVRWSSLSRLTGLTSRSTANRCRRPLSKTPTTAAICHIFGPPQPIATTACLTVQVPSAFLIQ